MTKFSFRLKKSNEAGFTANYPTQTAIDFHDHDNGCYQVSLFDLADYLRVEITYTLDALQVEIACIRVVARDKSKIAWSYEIQLKPYRLKKLRRRRHQVRRGELYGLALMKKP